MFRKRKALPVDKMIKLEDWIDSNINETDLCECDTGSKMSKTLKLKVEHVNAGELSKNIEAILAPIDDDNFFGVIRVCDENSHKSFSYMHEIMHYLYDVGRGQRVTRVFERQKKKKVNDDHEQDIDYLAASSIMKYREIKKHIRDYDSSSPKMDELAFIEGLCAKFNQERIAVIRRIREVRKVMQVRDI